MLSRWGGACLLLGKSCTLTGSGGGGGGWAKRKLLRMALLPRGWEKRTGMSLGVSVGGSRKEEKKTTGNTQACFLGGGEKFSSGCEGRLLRED